MLSMTKVFFSPLGRVFFSYTSVISCRSRKRTSRIVLPMTPRTPRTLFRNQSRRPQQLDTRPPPRARPARMSPSRRPSRARRGADLRCPAPAGDAPPPAGARRASAAPRAARRLRADARRRGSGGYMRAPPVAARHQCGAGGALGRGAAGAAGAAVARRGGGHRPLTPLPPPPAPLPLTPPPLSPTLACGEGRRPRLAAGTAALWLSRTAVAAAVAAVTFSGQGPRPWALP